MDCESRTTQEFAETMDKPPRGTAADEPTTSYVYDELGRIVAEYVEACEPIWQVYSYE